jgi:hypothetical protein
VCVSTDLDALKQLQVGDEQDNWSAIVNRLSAVPMQFNEDAFWRLKGPYLGQRGEVKPPKIRKHTEKKKVRQSEAVYEITENTGGKFELTSEIGQGVGR